jgi:hypothetical protein
MYSATWSYISRSNCSITKINFILSYTFPLGKKGNITCIVQRNSGVRAEIFVGAPSALKSIKSFSDDKTSAATIRLVIFYIFHSCILILISRILCPISTCKLNFFGLEITHFFWLKIWLCNVLLQFELNQRNEIHQPISTLLSAWIKVSKAAQKLWYYDYYRQSSRSLTSFKYSCSCIICRCAYYELQLPLKNISVTNRLIVVRTRELHISCSLWSSRSWDILLK